MAEPTDSPTCRLPEWNLSVSLVRGTVPSPTACGRFATVVGGPNDLLVWLESQLGLHAPSEVLRRMAALSEVVSAAIASGGHPLGIARSFAQHPYAVVGRLLEQRDSFMMALPLGARASAVPTIDTCGLAAAQAAALPKLIQEYAAVMASANVDQRAVIASAEPDRLGRVFAALEDGQRLPPCAITIADNEMDWPGRWRSVFALLQTSQPHCKVRWASAPPPACTKSGSALRGSQLAIDPTFESPTVPGISEDDTLRTVRCSSMAVASHAAAAALESLPPADLVSTVVVCEDDTCAVMIDGLLHSFGRPTMGASMATPCAETQALLPLVIEAVATPADPRRVKELLSLPDSPIPSGARRSLRKALDDLPAIGSPKWHAALQEIATRTPKGTGEVAEVNRWIPIPAAGCGWPAGFDPIDVRRAVEGLAVWAMNRAKGIQSEIADVRSRGVPAPGVEALLELDDLRRSHYQALHAACRAFESLLDARSAKGQISRTEYIQLLDASGQAPPSVRLHPESHGGPRRVRSFAEIDPAFGEVQRVVWVGTHTVPAARCHWSHRDIESQRTSLGIELDTPRQQLGAKRRAERIGLQRISESLLIISHPSQDSGERPHPLWVTISEMLRAGTASPTEASYEPAHLDASRGPVAISPWTIRQAATSLSALPPPVDRLPLPSHVAIQPRKTVSHSDVQRLLSCPLAWTLDYACRVKEQGGAGLKNDSALKGSALEQVMREVFESSPPATLALARTKLNSVLQDRLPFIHAALCQPASYVERRDFEHIAENALPVFQSLSEGGVALTFNSQVGQFLDVHGNPLTYNGLSPDGAIDVLGSVTIGGRVVPLVIDEKLGSREKYIKLLKDGRCWQLVMYADLGGKNSPGIPVDGIGYLVLTEGKLYVPAWAAGELAKPQFSDVVELVGNVATASLAGLASALTGQASAAAAAIQKPGAVIEAHPRVAAAGGPLHTDLAFVQGTKGEAAAKAACEYCEYGLLCGKDQVR